MIGERSPLIMPRRRFLGASAGIAALLYGGRLSTARAQGVEEQMNMMGWADYISPDNISAWEEANGSFISYDAYASNDEMYTKLLLSPGQSGYDLGMNTDFMIPVMTANNLLSPIDKALVPNLANIRPEYANQPFDPGNVYTIPKTTGSQGFIYDRSVITRPMETWQDFLEAVKGEASGRVSLLDDLISIAPLLWSQGISMNTTDLQALQGAEDRLGEFAPHVRMFNSYPVQDVASGAIVLAQTWNGNAKQAIVASGNENLVFVYPGPISELWLDSYHLPLGGKAIKAAHSWINYVLDPEVAARETAYTGFLSPVAGIEKFLPESVVNDPLIFPPAEAIARGERTIRNETYDRRIEIFTKFKAAAAG